MNKELIKTNGLSLESVLIEGDLSSLSKEQRVVYYNKVCESLGLNPLTKPFEYIKLQGKLTLYAKRDCAEQLRKLYGVSITDCETKTTGELYIVKVKAKDKTGKTDVASGVLTLKGLSGERLANAIMKAETKAKRRVTLSICGLGMLDETEVEDTRDAEPVEEDLKVIKEEPKQIESERFKAQQEIRQASEEKLAFLYDLKKVKPEAKKAVFDHIKPFIERKKSFIENKICYSLVPIDNLEDYIIYAPKQVPGTFEIDEVMREG